MLGRLVTGKSQGRKTVGVAACIGDGNQIAGPDLREIDACGDYVKRRAEVSDNVNAL